MPGGPRHPRGGGALFLYGGRARVPRLPAGGASLSGAPLIMSPGLVPGRLAPPAMRRAMYSKQLRLTIWLDGEAYLFFGTLCNATFR